MGVMSRIKQMMGGGSKAEELTIDAQEPSHVCESCGEEYYTDRSYEIDTCRKCGGIKVEML